MMRTIDEDYQDAAENLFGVDSVFDDVEAVIEDDELDVDWAVDRLYNTVYG
jgi:hypothetical protein